MKTLTTFDLALALQRNPKGWHTLYHSKGELQKEWLAAAKDDKAKAIKMLEDNNK